MIREDGRVSCGSPPARVRPITFESRVFGIHNFRTYDIGDSIIDNKTQSFKVVIA